jgi:hypothetical protein
VPPSTPGSAPDLGDLAESNTWAPHCQATCDRISFSTFEHQIFPSQYTRIFFICRSWKEGARKRKEPLQGRKEERIRNLQLRMSEKQSHRPVDQGPLVLLDLAISELASNLNLSHCMVRDYSDCIYIYIYIYI